jgi:hypothetical protein
LHRPKTGQYRAPVPVWALRTLVSRPETAIRFGAAVIISYLENKGSREDARCLPTSRRRAPSSSMATADKISLDEVEKIETKHHNAGLGIKSVSAQLVFYYVVNSVKKKGPPEPLHYLIVP